MKRAVLVVALLAFAACLEPATHWHAGVAAAATPTPAALQYDEINRMIFPPATPPAPGTFAADYQTIVAAASSGSQSSNSHGLGHMISNLMGNPGEMMQRMSRGNLVRYTFYNGWIRTDDPVAQTAVIEKCQQHQYINLDLAKKAYKVTDTQPPCPTMQGMPMMSGPRNQLQSQPGTADMTISGSSNDLGALTIDSIATNGYDQSLEMQTTNATGSCRNSSLQFAQTKYVSQVEVPRPYCPLPRTLRTGGVMPGAGSGCEPTMHVNGSIAAINDEDRLVMYVRTAMGAGAHGANMVVERGNVKWFSGAGADALFTVPPDFSQAQ